MAVSATVTPGVVLSENEEITISKLNSLGTPTVNIEGAVGTLLLSDDSVTNAKINSSAAIQHDKLAALSTGQLIVGNAGTPTATTVSGDVTIAADGEVTIANDAVTQAKIADDAVGADQIADGAVDGAAIAMGSDAQGDILYYDGTSYVRLGAGTAGQVLQSGGAGGNPSWVDQASNPSVGQIDFFTSGTSQTFTVPSGITRIKVSAGGGGGGGDNSNGNGKAGGYFEKAITVTAGTSVTYTVGAGGSGGESTGGSGGDTTVTYDGTTYTAGGGSGGGSGSAGTATGGTININGGASNVYLGYGGGGAGGDESTGSNGQGGFVKIEY